MPESLRRLTDDNEYADAGWIEPTPSQCRALAARASSALVLLEESFQPADDVTMSRCLASIALTCAPRAGGAETESTWRARAHEYKRLLGEFPADIWQKACDAWSTTEGKVFYPTTAELHALMQRFAEERRRRIRRLKRMLELAKPKPEEEHNLRYNELSPEQRAQFDATMDDFRRGVAERRAVLDPHQPTESEQIAALRRQAEFITAPAPAAGDLDADIA